MEVGNEHTGESITSDYFEKHPFIEDSKVSEHDVDSLHASDERHLLRHEKFLHATDVMDIILHETVPCIDRVPPGKKENEFFLVDNTKNLARRSFSVLFGN